MLENNNLWICRKLAWRELRFHKGRYVLLISSVMLVAGLCLFSLLVGSGCVQSVLANFKMQYGSNSDIIYKNLTFDKVNQLRSHSDIKKTAAMKTIGLVTDTALASRNIVVGITDEEYAKSIEAMSITGRMPESANEIALDEQTLDSLDTEPEIGSKIRIVWHSFAEEAEYIEEFILCGYWSTGMEIRESVAWVSEDFSKQHKSMEPLYTAGVTIHQPKNANLLAEKIIQDFGWEDISFTVNLSNELIRIDLAKEEGAPFYTTILLILACGIFMIYSIVHISIESDIRFYGRLKAFGMTPRQVKKIVLEQVLFICLPGILAGMLLGTLLYLAAFPYLIPISSSYRFRFISLPAYLCTGVLTWVTTLFACWIPAKKAQKAACAQAIHFVSPALFDKRKYRKTTLLKMAMDKVHQNPGRILLTIITIGFAMLLLCSTYIRYISYDEEIFLKAYSLSDYYISDASASRQTQIYNPHSNTITSDFIKALLEQEKTLDYGLIRTQEVKIQASPLTYKEVISFYETIGSAGIPRKEEMSYYPDWIAAYQSFKETKSSTSVVIGMDGIALQKAVNDETIEDGFFDAKMFASGNYVIALATRIGDESSNSPVGEEIAIKGKTYQVMAQAYISSSFIPGLDNKDASLSLSYILPMKELLYIYPNTNIRAMMFDLEEKKQKEMDLFLRTYKEEHRSRFQIVTRSDTQKLFHQSVFVELGSNFLIAFILVFIGMLSFVHLLISKTIIRKREFALYESLGMSRKQLRKLLMLEGILHVLFIFSILVCIVFIAAWFGMPMYFASSNEWAYTYQFSLFPLWCAILFFVVLSLTVPNICLYLLERKSITERFHGM